MSNQYPTQCIGHKAAKTEGSCLNLTGAQSGKGRKNPYWCPSCDEARIAHIDAAFKATEKLLNAVERERTTAETWRRELAEECTRQAARIEELGTQVLKYGQHEMSCYKVRLRLSGQFDDPDDSCSCGFDAARAAISEKKP